MSGSTNVCRFTSFSFIAVLVLTAFGGRGANLETAQLSNTALIQALSEENEDSTVRHRLAHALGQIGGDPKQAVPALVQCLSDAHPLVREHAATSLARFGSKDASVIGPLRKALRDPVPFVRHAAASTLRALGVLAQPAE